MMENKMKKYIITEIEAVTVRASLKEQIKSIGELQAHAIIHYKGEQQRKTLQTCGEALKNTYALLDKLGGEL
jgi:hypothetical protein